MSDDLDDLLKNLKLDDEQKAIVERVAKRRAELLLAWLTGDEADRMAYVNESKALRATLLTIGEEEAAGAADAIGDFIQAAVNRGVKAILY